MGVQLCAACPVRSVCVTVFVEDSYFHFPRFRCQARDPLADNRYMERETLLSTMWNTDGDEVEAAEAVRARLVSGDLVLTGNFRNVTAEGWRKDDDDE